jgi:hypothetical protein
MHIGKPSLDISNLGMFLNFVIVDAMDVTFNFQPQYSKYMVSQTIYLILITNVYQIIFNTIPQKINFKIVIFITYTFTSQLLSKMILTTL